MSETRPKKMVRRTVAVALGIICIILAVGLVGALAYSESMINANSQEQATGLRWTEGILGLFNLKPANETSYTISTGGFRTVTITIESLNVYGDSAFQIFIGFISENATRSWQVYVAKSWRIHSLAIPINGPPWYSETAMTYPNSLRQTYDVTFSQIKVWIWNNSTVEISGTVYYYLTA